MMLFSVHRAQAWLCVALALSLSAAAQSSSRSSTSSVALATSLSLATSSVTVITSVRSGATLVPSTTVLPAIFNVTVTLTPTSSSASATASNTSTPTPTPLVLDTRIDPAFGVLGGLLIVTGFPVAFLGHKNRWTSFFLIGFYTLSLTCIVLILKFGVLAAEKPPNKTLRGMYVLASSIAGLIGGGIAIFFWKGARYLIGGWGGFVVGLWVQCFRNGGLIAPIGLRYILYIVCAVVGFTLCTIQRIHYYVVIASTGFVGATAFILGIDCFTTANLKEFYVWNLGFDSLFPLYKSNGIHFPVSQTMEIELGLIGAVSLMGIAVQLQILKLLRRKLHEIQEEQRKRNEQDELRASRRFAEVDLERNEWEKAHGAIGMGERKESGLSSIEPLMKYQDSPATPTDGMQSPYGTRPRASSGLSDFVAPPRTDRSQSPGAIPALDLGTGIEDEVPQTFMASTSGKRPITAVEQAAADLEELKRKKALLVEIQEIRKSIQGLQDDQTTISSSSRSRRVSFASRRTLSNDLNTFVQAPAHLRPPRGQDPRARVQSMELGTLSPAGDAIPRPASVPLKEDWDSYVHDRRLVQPPSGVTPPIATTPSPRALTPVSPAVLDALATRQRRESMLDLGEPAIPLSTPTTSPGPSAASPSRPSAAPSPDSGALPARADSPDDDVPIAALLPKRPLPPQLQSPQERLAGSSAPKALIPVTILPPARAAGNAAPAGQGLGLGRPTGPVAPMPRTRTYEELTERHREKMRELQTPLSEAEQGRAALEAAKARWERSRALEREAVTRRQAEKAAAAAKERSRERERDNERRRERGQSVGLGLGLSVPGGATHERSSSAGALPIGGGSKRQSVMKVEDWQKRRLSEDTPREPQSGSSSRRASRAQAAVPFPEAPAKVKRMSAPMRDPPS